ncbi:GDYXXLXY domain-containing protein [Hymenobacter taeanensis]|uniref:GDYXXLXY domain-containing protein n=1 Tax=Hymenobacter taeanensis TaxID=2735321 RepID=A0A6M6BEX0_9BACT|nr:MULTISPECIES: GDYXXLXY domain-containing protein [Hymenobacter]QJX46482.1 GDYXXLXY domain-containing protein [Hymenobacter taeanensis]UOQ80346.1 GDYXXLXY domain-containing protein [Hymenobacter sp. 5414T-23]
MSEQPTILPAAAPVQLNPLPELAPAQHRRWLQLLVAAQVLFVLGVAVAGYATSALGKSVWLRTAPVDPRDLLYGDYVRLNYSISQLPGHLWHGAELPRRQQAAYVLLEPRNGSYEAIGVYAEKPEAQPNQAVLRGSVQDVWRRGLRLRYGLERYYVPEDMGREIEKRQSLRVQVSIAPWGQARITKVEVAP